MNIKKKIEDYVPYDKQEESDKKQFLKFIELNDDYLTRDNIMGHFSASAFVVNKEKSKMLVVYHIINDGWIYPGGHADGESDLLSVAIREVTEETGLQPKVLDNEIFAISSAAVQNHVKRGKNVSAHVHFDVIYLMEADDNLSLEFRPDESKGVKWVDFDNAYNNEVCNFARPVHKRLIKKLKEKN